MKRFFYSAPVLAVVLNCSACVGPTDELLRLYDEKKSNDMDWDDLTKTRRSPIPQQQLSDEVLHSLPGSMQTRPDLARLAILHDIENPRFYNNGVYGKNDHIVLYVTTWRRIGDADRLYWAKIRMLSEKYGCFMRNRYKLSGNALVFKCRDSRYVRFNTVANWEYIVVEGRQYDKRGREIFVENRRLISQQNVVLRER